MRISSTAVAAALALTSAACDGGGRQSGAAEAPSPAADSSAQAGGMGGGAHGGMAMAPQDSDPSRNFAKQMIEHHEGAVVMSQAALKGALDPEMQALARKIIADQEREIAQMQGFLQRSEPAG